MLCPVDCESCADPQCAGGCKLSGERKLAACDACGVVIVMTRRVHLCDECSSVAHVAVTIARTNKR